MYLIKTPEPSGQSCIEDLFPAEVTGAILNDKKFNPQNKIDPQTEYGKEVFANAVVKPNANKIDFSGFDPLLDRIAAVLDHFSSPELGE